MAGYDGWGADAETMDDIRAESGYECRRLTCPKCGTETGDLPNHLRACEGDAA